MAKTGRSISAHCVMAFVVISIPLLLSFTRADDKPNLVGLVISAEKPKFTWSDWFDRLYQDERDDYNNDHWAFKETSVRLNNQLYYSLFNQIRVKNFVAGKEHYVIAEDYIHSAMGDDLMAEGKVTDLLRKAKVVSDSLKKKNIDLVLGFVPGKGEYCKEFIEDKYIHPVTHTNYELFTRECSKLELHTIDLYSYFNELKPKAEYPLFTKFGHHWSKYGECLALQYIIKDLEKLRKTDLPDLTWQTVQVSDTARGRDADVLNSMNLYSPPQQDMKLGYPDFEFEDDSIKNNTRVLVLGDSYWYGPVYMGVNQLAFGYGDFWYYYNRVVPRRQEGVNLEVWELDLKQEIESHQVIMLMYADGNLPSYGNGFIEDAYELYTSPKTFYAKQERRQQIQTYAKQIRQTPNLLKKSTKKSREINITLDSAIKADAMKMAGLIK
jgi:hypothetical protein